LAITEKGISVSVDPLAFFGVAGVVAAFLLAVPDLYAVLVLYVS